VILGDWNVNVVTTNLYFLKIIVFRNKNPESEII
jgi:hypothetical protein